MLALGVVLWAIGCGDKLDGETGSEEAQDSGVDQADSDTDVDADTDTDTDADTDTDTDTDTDILVDGDGDGFTTDEDCDDADASSYPGAPETADGVDNDCDGITDEGTANYDDDGDGFSEANGDCWDSNSLSMMVWLKGRLNFERISMHQLG